VMAAPLIEVLPKDGTEFKLHVMDEEEPNAFALPGGHMIVTTGLLRLADRPEQIVGVLAHEVAHVTQRHAIRQQIAAAGPTLIFQVFLSSRGGLLSLLSGGSQLLIEQSFSQEYEIEADDVGWNYLVAASIDPRGLAEMLHKFKLEEERRKESPGLQAFSSHPATDKRIRRLEKKWRQLKNKPVLVDLAPLDAKLP
jgi:beta-barrel assembly-enhancing protease